MPRPKCTSIAGIYYIFVMLICAISLGITMVVLRLYHHQPNRCHMPKWVSLSSLIRSCDVWII